MYNNNNNCAIVGQCRMSSKLCQNGMNVTLAGLPLVKNTNQCTVIAHGLLKKET